jgi:hypothetical protein
MSIFPNSMRETDAHIASFLSLGDLFSLARVNKVGHEITKEMGLGQIFTNLHPKAFEKELSEAKKRKIERVKASTAEFNLLVTAGEEIKWVVTVSKVLWAVRMKVGDYEIKHSVASLNENCLTGGVAIYKKEKEDEVGRVFINHHTGHYQVGRVGLAAFGAPAWVDAGFRPIILTFHEIAQSGDKNKQVSTVTENKEYKDIMFHQLEKKRDEF